MLLEKKVEEKNGCRKGKIGRASSSKTVIYIGLDLPIGL